MYYQKLFNHMNEEHGLILLQTEMDAIINVVNEIQTEALRQSCVGGRSEQLKAFLIWLEKEGYNLDFEWDDTTIEDHLKSL